MRKRITGLVLCISILISCFAFGAIQTSAADTSKNTAGADYGLPGKIDDGNILHCFNWKYNDIKNELKSIAEAGFTAVQTSPAQPGDTSGKWYWLYQPCGFYVNYNDLGNRSELQSLCTEAKKYGIKVVVDIVANHLTGDHGKIQDDLKDGKYWHNNGKVNDWNNRNQLTKYNVGDYADLKTEDSYVQSVVKKYLNDLKSIGVSGFRFDAAKHIGTPAEGDNFFKMVKDVGLWSYGEILDNPGGNAAEVMKEYTKYIGVNDCYYSGELTGGMRDKKVVTNVGHWSKKGVDAAKLVYMAETHDTFSNNGNEGWTKNLDQKVIDRSYAILASRGDAQALYLSRPNSTDRESIYAGNKGSTHYKSKEVAAVNHFKNAMVGRKQSYTTGDGCDVVCRQGGAVIASANGSSGTKTVPNADGLVKPGTYTDEVSGSKWTVTSTTMTGSLGSTGIAVFYSTAPAGPSASATASTSYNTDTMKVTLSFENATSAQYSIDGGEYTSYKNGQVITIGQNVDYGESTKISVKAYDGTEWSSPATYTYTKEDPNAKQRVYFDNSSYNWKSVYAYIYSGADNNGKWPGQAMKKDSSTGYYVLDIPETLSDGNIIFTESDSETTPNRYPANKEPGLPLEGKTKIFKAGNTFEVYNPVKPKPTEAPTEAPTQAATTTPTEANTEAPSQTATQTINGLIGDANEDNKVNIKDATLIQKALASLAELSENAEKLADVNQNNRIDIKDATCIQKFTAMMDGSGNAGKPYGAVS